MMRSIPSLCLLCLLLSLSACRGRPAALASSTSPLDNRGFAVLGPAHGSSWGAMVLFIPMYGRMAEGARDDAIAQYDGADGLIDVSLDYTVYYLPLVTLTRAHIHGQAYKTFD